MANRRNSEPYLRWAKSAFSSVLMQESLEIDQILQIMSLKPACILLLSRLNLDCFETRHCILGNRFCRYFFSFNLKSVLNLFLFLDTCTCMSNSISSSLHYPNPTHPSLRLTDLDFTIRWQKGSCATCTPCCASNTHRHVFVATQHIHILTAHMYRHHSLIHYWRQSPQNSLFRPKFLSQINYLFAHSHALFSLALTNAPNQSYTCTRTLLLLPLDGHVR